MASSAQIVRLELTARAPADIRDALAEEMRRTRKILRDHLRDHLGGESAGTEGDA